MYIEKIYSINEKSQGLETKKWWINNDNVIKSN